MIQALYLGPVAVFWGLFAGVTDLLLILLIQVLPSDLFEGFKWPLQGLSDLHLGNQKVTWKKLDINIIIGGMVNVIVLGGIVFSVC